MLGGPVPQDLVRLHQAWDEGLWVPEGEPIPLDGIPARQVLGYGPALTPLVPFAFTGAGDTWCWATACRTPSGDPEIWLCLHDADDARVFAPDLAGWVYRCVLEHRADPGEPDDPAWADVLEALGGGRRWAEHLRSIGGAPVPPVDARIREVFGARYLESVPWQRGPREVTPDSADAVEAGTERMRQELAVLRRAEAITRADEAFRGRRYADVVAELEAHEGSLSAAVRAKLDVARRRM